MPTAPALIGEIAQSLLGRRAQVVDIERPAPDFLEVRFSADPPPGGWHPGHEVQIRASPTAGRRYTVCHVDGTDRIRVLAAVHGHGPGSAWFRGLDVGARAVLLAARFVPLRLRGSRRIFLGDGSALGTIDAYARTEPSPIVAVEVPPECSTGVP